MNILTFDIEDWFHIKFDKNHNNEALWNNYETRIEYNTNLILELLHDNGLKASFFFLGWIARKYPDLLRKVHGLGHDIGSHSDIHNLIYLQSNKEFAADLDKSVKSIEDIIGQKVILFRAPAFSIGENNLWAFNELINIGIEIDCSVFPAKHDFGGFKKLNINIPFKLKFDGAILKEFPITTFKIFGKKTVITGGGYFRFFPYFLIHQFMRKKDYNMTYFHPRDFDNNQPVLTDLNFVRKFKSYYGLKGSFEKFIRLIHNFDFISISEATNSINWDGLNTIDINQLNRKNN